ncbi:MAG: hypothetical protein GC204_00785 [Chloroflexi bacterium]|nr:hypothetical protein [Chloroflexota bacterium]
MFNPEREWILMEQHRHEQTNQAWEYRLGQEANRDHVSLSSRLLMSISRSLMNIGAVLSTYLGTSTEKPHEYISNPQDPVYN